MLMRFSAALTNRERLLEVVLAINPKRSFSATGIHEELSSLGVDKISHELRKLEAMGLVRETETPSSTVDFEIVDYEAWRALRALGESASKGLIAVP
jgi:Fe2+ or Zn2+ uptake regulation protein